MKMAKLRFIFLLGKGPLVIINSDISEKLRPPRGFVLAHHTVDYLICIYCDER